MFPIKNDLRYDSKRHCSMPLFSLYLVLVMHISVLPSTLTTLPVVRAQMVHVSTSLGRSQHGSTRRTRRNSLWYIGSPDWLDWGRPPSICKLLNEAGVPFASFYSLQLDSRNSKRLVTTLCRDLSEMYNSYAASVLSILETNPKDVHAGLRIQIEELLAKPWQASISQRQDGDTPTPIVVVDALDESDRGTEFLEELLRFIEARQLAGIRVLVTSRPEPWQNRRIVDICKSFPPNAVCKLHKVATTDVQSDIEKYLREALPELKAEPELALLAQRAGGFFIYATTAVRFISPSHSPLGVSEMRSQLQAMLNPEPLNPHADDGDER